MHPTKSARFPRLVIGLVLSVIASAPALGAVDCGQFIFHQSLSVGTHPLGLSAFDYDSDSTLDFVLANEGDGTITVIKNTAGVFSVHTTIGVGATPVGTAILDYNKDGRPDIAAVNNGSNTITLIRNLGSGSFTTVTNLATGSAPYGPLALDINNDGYTDLVFVNRGSGTVGVYRNSSSGFNTAMQSYSAGSGPIALASGDFDGNGYVDLAVANFDGNTISILMNTAGTLGAPSNYSVFPNPQGICAADFNEDGDLDLAVANNAAPTVVILHGNGAGSFGVNQTLPGGFQMQAAVAADFDRDGDIDLLVDEFNSNSRLFTNEGGLLVDPPTICDYGNTPKHIAVDWDRNFALDLAATLYNSDQCNFYSYTGPRVKRVPAEYLTIQDAIDACVNGDTVVVSAGYYGDNLTFGQKSIVLLSESGATQTTLYLGTTISISGPASVVIDGFALHSGAGIVIQVTQGGNLELRNDSFRDFASLAISAVTSSTVGIQNCFFLNATASSALNVHDQSHVDMLNCTIVGAGKQFGTHAVYLSSSSTGNVRNSIITDHGTGLYADWSSNATISAGYNDIWNCNTNYVGTQPGPGARSADPEFVSPQTGYYELQPSSPCIDAGDPDSLFNDPDGSRCDMGALPFSADSVNPGILRVADVEADQGGRVTIAWSRSKYDLPLRGGIAQYSIWRAIPSGVIATASNAGSTTSGVMPSESGAPAPRTLTTALGTFQWEWIGTMPSHYFAEYSYTAATLFDSSALTSGKHYFLISAHSPDGIHVYDSDPDSGYSVDNLAPPAPQSLAVSSVVEGLELTWSPVDIADLSYYQVFRDTVPGVSITTAPTTFVSQDTTIVDGDIDGGKVYYYRVVGIDFAGNRSAPSNEAYGSQCDCPCAADPICDGIRSDLVDVVRTIEVAFRGSARTHDPICPVERTDVNCSGTTDVVDIVRMIDVAFRGADVATKFCLPCGP